tara:strand:- start:3773 stop:4162 length:390 start_codon:yes stop_codon:yes gene_type:complete
MNYLSVAKKDFKPETKIETVFVERKPKKIVLTDDENYFANTQDSEKIFGFDDIRDMCECFIEDTLLMDRPLLYKHHIGLKNFTNDILQLFEKSVEVEIIELIHESDDEENTIDELNDIIIDELYKTKYF